MRLRLAFVIVVIVAPLTVPAQPPHLGSWVIDHARSDGGEQVWEFLDLGSGLWELRIDGWRVFRFRMDDEECPTCEASLYTWDLIGPETYLTSFLGPRGRDVVKIEHGGRSLSLVQRRPGAAGELEDHIATFRRFSGGSGLAGTWVATAEQSLSPFRLDLAAGVADWLVLEWTPLGRTSNEWICVVLLDGVDHPCFNARAPGRTIALELIDSRTLRSVFKIDGSAGREAIYQVSPDGSSMVRTESSVTGRSISTVYERQ